MLDMLNATPTCDSKFVVKISVCKLILTRSLETSLQCKPLYRWVC